MIDKNAGKKWPWIIGVSIVAIIFASGMTIDIALTKAPVEESDYGMQNYHEYDANVNEIIEAKIQFDRLYTITLVSKRLDVKSSVIEYNITDKKGDAINNASVTVLLTRPDTTKLNMTLNNPSVHEGVYTFDAVELPKEGRWDVLAKVNIAGKQRYYNIKADTRNDQRSEF